MTGVQGQILGHVVRRTVQMSTAVMPGRNRAADAQVYDVGNSAPGDTERIHEFIRSTLARLSCTEKLTIYVLLGLAAFHMLLLVSSKYTVGEVISSLAMIEQPKKTAISETTIVDDEKVDPDAPLEKTAFINEELAVIEHPMITTNLKKSLVHLHKVGGFRARWRGLGISMVYHFCHALLAQCLMVPLMFINPMMQPLGFIIASVLLARIHMTWTHIMVSGPSEKPWYRRMPRGMRVWKALFLPSLVYAVSQQLVVVLPMVTFFVTQVPPSDSTTDGLVFRLFCSLVTAECVALFFLMPASVVLTRVEASLLPEDEDTIVEFDRTINGAAPAAIALDSPKGNRALFVQAWHTVDKACRIRIMKFYVKYFFLQCALVTLMVTSFWGIIMVVGVDNVANFVEEMIGDWDPLRQ